MGEGRREGKKKGKRKEKKRNEVLINVIQKKMFVCFLFVFFVFVCSIF